MNILKFLLIPFLVLGACGDDTMNGLDPNKKLADLDDSEVMYVCEFQEDEIMHLDREKVLCFANAEKDAIADPTIVCADQAAECIADLTPTRQDCSEVTATNSGLSSCSDVPTVGDLELCIIDDGDWFQDLAQRVTCENVAEESQKLPLSCMMIASECPLYFE